MAQFEPKSLALTNRKHWHKLNRVIQIELKIFFFAKEKKQKRVLKKHQYIIDYSAFQGGYTILKGITKVYRSNY